MGWQQAGGAVVVGTGGESDVGQQAVGARAASG